MAVAAVGLLLVTQADSAGGLSVLITGFALACVGIAVPSALGINLIIGAAPAEKAGAASGMSETSGEFGIAFGVAMIGSVAAAVYRSQVAVPSDVPAEAASVAGESLPGAVGVADSLPASLGAELLVPAREAFASGLHVAAVIGAVIFAVMAVLACAVFRHLRPYGEAEQTTVTETAEGGAAATSCVTEHDLPEQVAVGTP